MKKLIFTALLSVVLVSCNGYIEKYEDICKDARGRISVATTQQEIKNILKQTSSDLAALGKEYPKEMQKYKKADEKDKSAYKKYRRRVKARNSVTQYGLSRILAMKKGELANKNAVQE